MRDGAFLPIPFDESTIGQLWEVNVSVADEGPFQFFVLSLELSFVTRTVRSKFREYPTSVLVRKHIEYPVEGRAFPRILVSRLFHESVSPLRITSDFFHVPRINRANQIRKPR
jgi:hypothetical protein